MAEGFRPSGQQLPQIVRWSLEKAQPGTTAQNKNTPTRKDVFGGTQSTASTSSNRAFTRQELEDQIMRASACLSNIQWQLQRGEESYHDDTASHGNIYKGWDGIVDAKDAGLGGGGGSQTALGNATRRVPADCRWFSDSSQSGSGFSRLLHSRTDSFSKHYVRPPPPPTLPSPPPSTTTLATATTERPESSTNDNSTNPKSKAQDRDDKNPVQKTTSNSKPEQGGEAAVAKATPNPTKKVIEPIGDTVSEADVRKDGISSRKRKEREEPATQTGQIPKVSKTSEGEHLKMEDAIPKRASKEIKSTATNRQADIAAGRTSDQRPHDPKTAIGPQHPTAENKTAEAPPPPMNAVNVNDIPIPRKSSSRTDSGGRKETRDRHGERKRDSKSDRSSKRDEKRRTSRKRRS